MKHTTKKAATPTTTTSPTKAATTKPKPNGKATVVTKDTKRAKAVKALTPQSKEAIAKLEKWNEKHPDRKFSWVMVSLELPAVQRTCRHCKKEFKEGRLTRVDSTGAYCGPRCQLAATKSAKPAKSSK